EYRPDLLEDAALAPALKPAVRGRIVAAVLRQVVPLATGAQAMDDRVKDRPPGTGRPATLGTGLPVGGQDGRDARPEIVRDFPDRVQRFGRTALPCHAYCSSIGRSAHDTEARPPPQVQF